MSKKSQWPKQDRFGHRTRLSDSSVFDEICTLCGATDGRGDERLNKKCPNAKETADAK